MAEEFGEKSHDATPHRRQQARDEGQIARSQDLNSAGLLAGALVVLIFAGGTLVQFLGALVARSLSGEGWSAWIDSGLPTGAEAATAQWFALLPELARALLPILLVVLLLAVAINVAQTGFLWVPHLAMPDLSRINPLTGLGRLFSLSSWMRLTFGLFKILVIGVVAGICLYQHRHDLMGLSALDLPQIALFAWELCLWTTLKIAMVLVVLAALDYGYQRWKHESDLKMTQQELREEMRNLQGDPQIISRRRAVQRQLALNRLSQAVPKADVVITNPTELAVALQYDADKMNAPVVVAKGAGVIAARIRRLALENGIPIVEKKPLAQALYKEVDLNHPIPDKLYAAVAEVLAYVYQLKGKPIPNAPV